MITCILIILMLYILYKLVRNEPIPYLSNNQYYDQGFRVSAWDSRDINFKQCLNNYEGIRHNIYPEYANICNISDTFNKYL